MTTAQSFVKDPDAVLDFVFDWAPLTNETDGGVSDWLASGETINAIEGTGFTVSISPSGLTKDSATRAYSNTAVRVWLSGGTVDVTYSVSCKIVTSDGRTDERTIYIRVAER